MEPQKSDSRSGGLLYRLVDTTGRTRLAFMGLLVSLVAIFSVGLKLLRFSAFEPVPTFAKYPQLIRSEIFVVVAFSALCLGAASLGRRRALELGAQVAMQCVAAWIVFSNVVGHYFFVATGSSLNWPVFRYGLRALRESPDVILSEIPATGWVLLAAGLVLVFAAPPVASRWIRKRSEDQDRAPSAGPRMIGLCIVVACVGFLVAAIPDTDPGYETGATRDAGMHLLLTAVANRGSTQIDGTTPHFDISSLRLKPASDEVPKNTVFIVLESTRASSTTLYDAGLETTPFLADLAKRSQVFEQAYAVIPHTSKALAAILCGIPPRPNMEITEAQPGGIPGSCLPALLGDQGYESAFFQSATEKFEFRRGLVANMGFDDFFPLEEMDTDGYQEANYFGYEDDVMLPSSRRWHDGRGEAPFITTYLTITPHHDYLAPETYGRFEFAEDDTFNRYLNSLRYIDHFVENLIEQYRELGIYDDTLFVIVGDHGEAFGEHGREQHDNVPYQEGVHVPLLIHDGSGALTPQIFSNPVSHIDLAPTVVDLLDFDTADGSYPGVIAHNTPEERPIYFRCWYDDQCIGTLVGRHKFIDHLGNRPNEIFDVIDDPDEQHNLIDSQPARVSMWQDELPRWAASVDTAYAAFFQDVINRRVLASPPQMTHSVDRTVGDLLEVVGYQWSDENARQSATLRIVVHVLQDFTDVDDPPTWVFEDEQGTRQTRTPLGGTYASLFWQQGQYLVDEIPADWFHRLNGNEWTLTLEVGEHAAEVGDVSR